MDHQWWHEVTSPTNVQIWEERLDKESFGEISELVINISNIAWCLSSYIGMFENEVTWPELEEPCITNLTLSAPLRKHLSVWPRSSKISGNKQLWQKLNMLSFLICMLLPIMSHAVEVHEVILNILHRLVFNYVHCSSEKEAIIVHSNVFLSNILCQHCQVSSYMPDNETTVELRLTLKSRLGFASNINTITISVIW